MAPDWRQGEKLKAPLRARWLSASVPVPCPAPGRHAPARAPWPAGARAETSSGAYGIPQAVPGSKMASAGPHWRTSARTQIRWGLSYIRSRYGTPCGAWAHSNAYGWY